MRNLIIVFLLASLAVACNNTKQGTGEPTTDSKFNPAEMPVDSVGSATDIPDRASTDSNKTANPTMPSGTSDLQNGPRDTTGKAISSDGNIINK